jgi:hypothetical protein
MSANLETKRITVIKDDSINTEDLLKDVSINNEESFVEKYNRLSHKLTYFRFIEHFSIVSLFLMILFDLLKSTYFKDNFVDSYNPYLTIMIGFLLMVLFIYAKFIERKTENELSKIENKIVEENINKRFGKDNSLKNKIEDFYIETNFLIKNKEYIFSRFVSNIYLVVFSLTVLSVFIMKNLNSIKEILGLK